jgi:CRP/FNR family transcriptional regulator
MSVDRTMAAIPGLDEPARDILARLGVPVAAPPGARVFEPGRHCELFYLLARGTIRVQIVSESGREIVLYRIGPGDACVMTVSCLMGQGPYTGEGIVETAVEGIAVGPHAFGELMARSAPFRNSILSAYSARFLELVEVLENVAFRPLDARLAERLLQLDRGDGAIACTHQFLATDIGSSREVVSRVLKRWEDEGLIRMERGLLSLPARQRLAELAAKGGSGRR